MSLLSQQLATFRKEHGISEKAESRAPPPSLLFSPEEAKKHDPESFAALGSRGIASLAALEPDVAQYARLFEGPVIDRDTLMPKEHDKLNSEIHHLLLLLSPHFPIQASHDVLEGLLFRYRICQHNVDDVMACALPYHDSPAFTRLMQGLHVEGKPQWSWLKTLKAKPATLVRSTLAKYAAKDLSVLTFLGGVVEETAKLQKANRALSTLFAALWLDVLAGQRVSADVAALALPAVGALLRRPHLRDGVHAGLAVAGALCARQELAGEARGQLLERAARQVPGESAASACAFLALCCQLQGVRALPAKALKALAAAGPQAVADSLPTSLDCGNFLAALIEGCLVEAVAPEDGKDFAALVRGLLQESVLVDQYAPQFCMAAFQAFEELCSRPGAGDAERKSAAKALREPLAVLGDRQPAALGSAFKLAMASVLERGVAGGPELLARLVAPNVALEAEGEGAVPVVQAFSHSSEKVRWKAVRAAVTDLAACAGKRGSDGDNRQRLMLGLATQAVDDADLGVARKTLQLDELWALPQLQPSAALRALEGSLGRMGRKCSTKAGLRSSFASVFFEEERSRVLTPLVLRRVASVYVRTECTKAARSSIDTALMPLLVLGLVGLGSSAGGKEREPGTDDLQSALLEFCKVSEHPLFVTAKASTPASSLVAMAAATASTDASIVPGLCRVAMGKAWVDSSSDKKEELLNMLGGAPARLAAVVLLAQALPKFGDKLLSSPEAEQILRQCVDVCRVFSNVECSDMEPLCQLIHAVFSGAAILHADTKAAGVGKAKRGSSAHADGGAMPSGMIAREVVLSLTQLVLERPASLSAVLKLSLGSHPTLLRAALLRIALGPDASPVPPAAIANALHLLRSLATTAPRDWALDPCLCVPLTARIASVEAREVREAALGLLEALDSSTKDSRESLLAVLLEAGVLRSTGSALGPKGLAAALKLKPSPASASEESVCAFAKLSAKHRSEILQDQGGIVTVLARFLCGKGSIAKPGKEHECAFWAMGLSQLGSGTGPGIAHPLLTAIPVAGLFVSLREPLRAGAQETTEALSGDAPSLLALASLACSESLRSGQAGGTEQVFAHVREVVQPFCAALAKLCESGGDVSDSVAELGVSMCKCLMHACKHPEGESIRGDTVDVLFRFSVASAQGARSSREAGDDETPMEQSALCRTALAARSALLDVPMSVAMLRRLAGSPLLRESSKSRSAMEVVYEQIASFTGDEAVGELLADLGDLVKKAAAKHGKGTALPAASPLPHAMLAIAAVSEHAANAASADSTAVNAVPKVCESVAALCRSLGAHLTGPLLAAAVRACAAMSTLTEAPRNLELGPPPVTLQTCVDALACYQQPLGADGLNMLKASFRHLWLEPSVDKVAGDTAEDHARREVILQSRLRLLLYSTVVKCPNLIEILDENIALSLARSLGLKVSLDFILLMMLVRRSKAGPAKKVSRKRRGAAKEADLEEAVPLADSEKTAEEALRLLKAVSVEDRYICVGTLAQTLCCLAVKLSRTAKGVVDLSLGPSLLPEGFLDDLGPEGGLKVLEAGLSLVHAFTEEVGLLEGLDGMEVNAAGYRSMYGGTLEDGAAGSSSPSSVPLAVCYVARSVCIVEAVLAEQRDEHSVAQAACLQSAQDLRSLLLRSLAVNHPRTFFQAIALALQIPDLSPPVAKKGSVLAGKELRRSITMQILLSAGDALQERKGLRDAGGSAEGNGDACASLCIASMAHVCRCVLADAASDASEMLHVVAWRFVGSLTEFASKTSGSSVLEIVFPVATTCLDNAPGIASGVPGMRAAVACCLSLQVAVEQMGRAVLERMNTILPVLLKLIGCSAAAKGPRAIEATSEYADALLLEQAALRLLRAFVRSVGSFMSPFLERVILLTTAPCASEHTLLLEDLGGEIVAQVPHRLVLPALHADVVSVANTVVGIQASNDAIVAIDTSLVQLQRLGAIMAKVFAESTVEFVETDGDVAVESVLRLFDAGAATAGSFLVAGGHPAELPTSVVGRNLKLADSRCDAKDLAWAEWCGEGSLLKLYALGGATFAQLALRLPLEELKPRFVKVVEWSRNSQTLALSHQSKRKADDAADALADSNDVCRTLALCLLMSHLATEVPELAEELLLPLTLKDLSSSLSAARRCALQLAAQKEPEKKKRRRLGEGRQAEALSGQTWWWFEVSTTVLRFVTQGLQPAAKRSTRSKVSEDAVEALTDPCADLIDVCKHMPPVDDSPLAFAYLGAIQDACVALAAASDGAHVKSLLNAILTKSRSGDVEVRLGAVRVCHKIWTDLGVQVITTLSDVVMYAVELLEDEDPRVEGAVRALIRTMEDCTGESLQDHLKR